MRTLRGLLATGLVGILATMAIAACSSGPSTQARACTSKTQMQASLDELRQVAVSNGSFNVTNANAAHVADLLDSMRNELTSVEGAVHLPNGTALQQLGGVGYLRQLESNLNALAQSLRGSGSNRQPVNVSTLESEVMQRAAQVQRVTDAIAGC
jgi:hypothetical protein